MTDPEREARVRARAVLFAEVARRVHANLEQDGVQLVFRADAPVVLSAAYFLLNDAYKQRRAKPGSLTDDHKKAALTAVATMVVRPFAPMNPDAETFGATLANPIYAFACALSWLDPPASARRLPFDYLKRFYLSLLNVRMPSMARFIDLVNIDGRWQDYPPIAMSPSELDTIDDWVWRFFMLSSRKT